MYAFHKQGTGYRANCKDCRKAMRLSHSNGRVGREAEQRAHLQARYGMTLEDKARMAEEQGQRCAICKRWDVELVVDHCHNSNLVRGLLCNKCNIALGLFADSVVSLENAIKYLRDPLDLPNDLC